MFIFAYRENIKEYLARKNLRLKSIKKCLKIK
jgi:hypothetical protein